MYRSCGRRIAKKQQALAHSSEMLLNGKCRRRSLHFKLEVTGTTEQLLMQGRRRQRTRGISPCRQFIQHMHQQLLLQMRASCCLVDLPRCLGRKSALLGPGEVSSTSALVANSVPSASEKPTTETDRISSLAVWPFVRRTARTLGKEPIPLPVSERAKQLAAPSSMVNSSPASTSEIPSAADCMSSLGVGPSSKLPVAPVLGSYSDAGLAAIASGSSLVKELVAASRRTAAGSASASRDDELTKHESYRLNTFCNVWAYDRIVDARELARNGFFYAGPGDRVQCAFCQGLVRNWEPGDRVDEQHAQHFTYCRFVQGHDVGNVPIPFWPLAAKQASDVHAADTIDASGADLGITSTPPKNPEFVIEARRLSTFATWPANHHLQPDILAKAGFFYLGKEDAARCFFCDGTVVDWRTDCDPWVEHAHRFPSCSFVLQVKGHDFVQRHRMQSPPAASSSRPSLAVDPREVRARMDSNKVRVLLHMDYPLDLIREVVQKRLATVGSDHESSEQLLEDVFQTHDEKQKTNSTQGAARRATSDSSGPVVVVCTPARGPDELGVQSLPNDVVQSWMVAVALSAPAAARTDSSLPMYNPMAAADKLPPLTSLPTTAQLPEGRGPRHRQRARHSVLATGREACQVDGNDAHVQQILCTVDLHLGSAVCCQSTPCRRHCLCFAAFDDAQQHSVAFRITFHDRCACPLSTDRRNVPYHASLIAFHVFPRVGIVQYAMSLKECV